MVRNCPVVFIVVIATLLHSCESRVVPKTSSFTFLGKISNSSTLQRSLYFLSQHAAPWSKATKDCKANYGYSASLVDIETEEEFQKLYRLLQTSFNTASAYWVGGKYDSARSTFVWNNGVKFMSSAPWDEGHPKTKIPKMTRVLAYRMDGRLRLQTNFRSAELRFICELPL